MRYYEVIIMDNVAKIQHDVELNDGDLILGAQEREVRDLSNHKIHTQQIKGTGKVRDFYQPSSNLTMREIVSSRAKSFLESYRKGNIKFYPCPVIRGKELMEGFWITDKVVFDDEWIDFNKSDFVYVNRKLIKGDIDQKDKYEKNLEILSFKNLTHLKEFEVKEMWYMDELNPHKIFIKEGCPYSILSIPSTGIFHLIFTEEVKIKLQKQKMSAILEEQ